MGDVAKHFISEFHNLPGETIKEKQQNFYNFLQRHSPLKNDPERLASIAANLEPTNHLEKILRTDFLIYFKIFHILHKDFIKGDEITVKKVSKQEWFFQQAFKEVNHQEFTNNILPAISHSLKLKILKRLPVREETADQFFDSVCKRYGVFLATVLLPKCSSIKINNTFKQFPVKLTVAQLKCIFNKDPNLIYSYVEERVKIEGSSAFMNNNPIFKFIAQKNPQMFTNLFKRYNFDIKLGRRTSKVLINSQKSTILDNNKKYVKVLNKGVMVRKVGGELKKVLFDKLPSGHELYWKSLLCHYPKHHQFDIFKSAYDNVYCHRFGDDIHAVTQEMLNIMTNPEEREKIALLKREQENKDDYLKYATSQYCLKEFMDKINHLSTSERANYVKLATECCCLNKDMSSLLKLCEVVCVRFKNDDSSVQKGFLEKISSNKNILCILEKEHWKYITEIMAILNAKNGWFYCEHILMASYVKYLVKNNQSLKGLAEKSGSWNQVISYSDIQNDHTCLKKLLSELIKIGNVKAESDDDFAFFDCELANYCKIYNDKNPNDPISVSNNSRIIKSVQQVLEASDHIYFPSNVFKGIQYMICQPTSCEEIDQLKKVYFKNIKSGGHISALMWFLKHEPKTLQENFDEFLNSFVDSRGLNPPRLWKLCKKYTHLDMDRRTVEFCKQHLAEEGFLEKKKLVRPLTILSSPTSHLDLIKSYIPTSEKVDLTDDDVKDLYVLQGQFVKLLHYLNDSRVNIINATFNFCKGDYLQFALSPLYSCIYKLPENETKPFINKLDEIKALSVRKHAMNLSCVIYDADAVLKCLKNATVPSLIPTIKYFSKNPSEALWNVIETQISALEKNEIQILKLALKIHIPVQYKSRYIEAVWNILDKHGSKELKKLLLPQINKNSILNLNSEFAFNIIRSSIFNIEEADDVVANILIYLDDDKKYTVLTDILSNFKRNCWNHPKMRKSTRRKLNIFMLNLFCKYIKSEESNVTFVTELQKLFSSIFTLSEAFEESVAIKFMAFKGDNIENHSKFLIELNNSYGKEYGPLAVNVLTNTCNNYIFKHVYTNNNEKLKLCHSLLQLKKTIEDYLLIIKLLPTNEPEDQKSFQLYNSILIELRQVSNNIVQLEFNLYLKSGPYKNINLDWDTPRLCSNIC